jgi:ADP-heptose:LPS heptosyltransferase
MGRDSLASVRLVEGLCLRPSPGWELRTAADMQRRKAHRIPRALHGQRSAAGYTGQQCKRCERLVRAARSGWDLPIHPHTRPAITLSDSEVEFARALLRLNRNAARRPRVGFCSAASSKLKRWPESRFAAVADWTIESGHRAILFGCDLDGSEPMMRRLMSHGARSAVGHGLHLRRVAAVLAQCAALVSNDTGLMHIAAAMGTRPVVAVFGPTSPRVYLPRERGLGLASSVGCPHRAHI